MRNGLCLISCQALILAWCPAGVQNSPAMRELPPLVIDYVAPAVRIQIQEAYVDARANLNDEGAIGRLGMVLETYGLLKEATVYYRIASQLAPSTFRWAYYLGVVEAGEGSGGSGASQPPMGPRLGSNQVASQ